MTIITYSRHIPISPSIKLNTMIHRTLKTGNTVTLHRTFLVFGDLKHGARIICIIHRYIIAGANEWASKAPSRMSARQSNRIPRHESGL